MFTDDKKDLIVRKSNNLVNARYNLTTNETKVFLMLLYKLQYENSTLNCTLSLEDFKYVIKSSRDKTIANISSIFSELRRKPIYFIIPNTKDNTSKWGEYGFINGWTFDETNNNFEIEASKKIYAIMQNYLKDGFTPNNLLVLFSVRNAYSYRIYDLLRVWSGVKNIINYPVEKLREYLMLEDKYPLYADFKKRAIMPAIKELNKTGVLEIELREVKKGRKIVSIDFIVKDNDKRKGFNEVISGPIPVAELLNEKVILMPTRKNTDEVVAKKIKEETIPTVDILEMIKYTGIPDTHLFNSRYLNEFTIYCYENDITFNNVKDHIDILKDAQKVFKEVKGIEIVKNKPNYCYFLGIFKNKLETLREADNKEILKTFGKI